MTFQFKIQLKNISDPTVWRRVKVPAQFSFLRFHLVIQSAFGWDNYHLFQFSPSGYGSYPTIAEPHSENDDYYEITDAKKTKLSQLFTKEKQTFTYIYDFGDDWKHKITLEKIILDKTTSADCIAGKGSCPPEDCGGPWGYVSLLEILNDPANPQYADMKEWLGLEDDEEWNRTDFDLEETRAIVRLV